MESINEFATVLGYEVHRSGGKSRDAIRTVDLDRHLIEVLRQQRKLQAEEQLKASTYEATDYVFTKPVGGEYHPQHLPRLLGKISAEVGLPRLTARPSPHERTLILASGVPPKVAAERIGDALFGDQ
jgi:hypothetical protein